MTAPLIIDSFAGGGGASTGLEDALGRPVNIAINHDEAAIAVHAANHPGTKHYCQSIFNVDPLEATGGAPVLLAWFSPDCKHHSKAKGGKPRDKNIRDMAWIVPQWIERLKYGTPGGRGAPQVIMLENVEEFRQWGPLDEEGMPIKERRGEEFELWVGRIRQLGYEVEHRELRASDYGAPTSRKRLFLIARCDGKPIVWPEPTHGHPDSEEVASGKLLPWRTAAECIDWTIPCPSIFGRKRPLKDATCRRIAAGVMRYVVNSAKPFIIPLTHQGGDGRVYDVDAPLPTVTGAHRGEMACVSPGIVPITHTKGHNQATPADSPLRTVTTAKGGEFAATAANLVKLRNNSHGEDIDAPLGAVCAGGLHHAIAETMLAPALVGVGGRRGQSAPVAMDAPHPTITAKADGAIAAASLAVLGHGARRNGEEARHADISEPISTVMAGGGKHAALAAFMHKYRPNSVGAAADAPLPTVTANSFVKKSGGAAPLAVTTAHLEQANTGMVGHDAREPLSTIVGKGCTQRLVETTIVEEGALPPEMMDGAVRVAAFLCKYYGAEAGQHQPLDTPIDTITAKPRFAVVTVTIDTITYIIVDIGMRMLEPRELANAMAFPPTYVLDPVCTYKTDTGRLKIGPLPKSHQIAKIGNAVCPVMSKALSRSNLPEHCPSVEALAA